MRVGLVLDTVAASGWVSWREAAHTADTAGLDVVMIRDRSDEAPLLLAAALAGVTTDVRVLVEIGLDEHPVHLAERIAVADQALAGRLIVMITCGADHERAIEAIELLRLSLSSRPFRHIGTHWQVPAELSVNEPVGGASVRVMPPPAQLELPIWVGGHGGPAVSAALGATWVADTDQQGADVSSDSSRVSAGPAFGTRVAIRRLDEDLTALATQLRSERAAWGLDLVLVSSPSAPWNRAAVAELARTVRPLVQLPELPHGIAEFWAASTLD